MSEIIKQLEGEFTKLKADLEQSTAKNVDEKMAAINEAIESLKSAKPEVSADDLAEIKSDLNATIKALDMVQTRVKNTGTAANQSQPEAFGDVLLKAMDDARDGIKEMKNGHRKSVSLNLKEMKDMTFAGNFPTASASVATVRPGIIPGANRKLHIRQLLQPGTMSGSTYNYVKESSISGGPVGPAAEGTTKPQININLAEVASPAQWIAGFLVASRNMMDDILAFSSYLQTRLPELLLNAEDNQIINGTGTSPQLSGILDAGNFTAATTTATAKVSALIESIGQLEGLDREANGILLNPADYYALMLNTTTAGEFSLPDMLTTIVNGQLFLAGVPVYKSTALTVNNFIVGDWVMGANLITREPVRVEFFYEDSTNVRQNNVTVRVEERVALPIYGDNYFIAGEFA